MNEFFHKTIQGRLTIDQTNNYFDFKEYIWCNNDKWINIHTIVCVRPLL